MPDMGTRKGRFLFCLFAVVLVHHCRRGMAESLALGRALYHLTFWWVRKHRPPARQRLVYNTQRLLSSDPALPAMPLSSEDPWLSKIVPPAGYKIVKHMCLWGTFLTQIMTPILLLSRENFL